MKLRDYFARLGRADDTTSDEEEKKKNAKKKKKQVRAGSYDKAARKDYEDMLKEAGE